MAVLFTIVGSVACIPPCVLDELSTTRARAYSALTRIQHGEQKGWLERVPSFTDEAQYRRGPPASVVADRVRARIAETIGASEDNVETTDTLLPGIAVQLLASDRHDSAGVLIKDKHAAESIATVVDDTGYGDDICVYRGKPFLGFVREHFVDTDTESIDPEIY